MKFSNLYQDPESDSDAPYADTLVLDAGGMDVKYGGDTVAHVSFEDVDPFELAYHAMPSDWEPHESRNGNVFGITDTGFLENEVYELLTELGKLRGWERS